MILEVDSRENDGLLVRLSFDNETGQCFVDVVDNQTGKSYTLKPEKEQAKDYYDHPYAYIKEGTVHNYGFATQR